MKDSWQRKKITIFTPLHALDLETWYKVTGTSRAGRENQWVSIQKVLKENFKDCNRNEYGKHLYILYIYQILNINYKEIEQSNMVNANY